MNANGTINVLERDGQQVFEAIYQQSYRHSVWRVGQFKSEGLAIDALECRAKIDGVHIGIQAGRYPRGTRKLGSSIA